MKVFKMEVMFLDFDNLGEDGVKRLIEDTRYPNHILAPKVMEMESVDIVWSDAHPLNKRGTQKEAYARMFKSVNIDKTGGEDLGR